MSPVAIAWILKPAGTVGASPGFHPTALGTLIGGSRYWLGSGSHGLGPYWRIGAPPLSLQAARKAAKARTGARVSARIIRPLLGDARVRGREPAPPSRSTREARRRGEEGRRSATA